MTDAAKLRTFLSRLPSRPFCMTCLANHGYFTNHDSDIWNRLHMGKIAEAATQAFPSAIHRGDQNCHLCTALKRCVWFSH